MTTRPHQSATVDDLLTIVENRGFRLANLFQYQIPGLAEWRWQANVTDGLRYWEFGRGSTAVEALRAALFSAATTEPTVVPAGPPPGPPPKPSPSSNPDIEI